MKRETIWFSKSLLQSEMLKWQKNEILMLLMFKMVSCEKYIVWLTSQEGFHLTSSAGLSRLKCTFTFIFNSCKTSFAHLEIWHDNDNHKN